MTEYNAHKLPVLCLESCKTPRNEFKLVYNNAKKGPIFIMFITAILFHIDLLS